MEIVIKSVRNPIWANSEKTMINCLIKTNHLKKEVTFTASPFDSEEYGKRFFNKLISAKYGKISEYIENNKEYKEGYCLKKPDEKTIELMKFIKTANNDLLKPSSRNLIILCSTKLESVFRKYLINNIVFNNKNLSNFGILIIK